MPDTAASMGHTQASIQTNDKVRAEHAQPLPKKDSRVKEAPYAIWKWITIGSAAVIGEWARIPNTVQILIMLMGLDIVSGICAAIATRTVNSSIMLRGMFKKLAVFPLLALLHIIEKPLNLGFEFEAVAALAFIVYESMSVIENCANAGVPIPSVIVSALAKAKVKTATAEEIREEFEQTSVTVKTSSEIVKTPDSQPDLRVEKKTTVLEEKHVEPLA